MAIELKASVREKNGKHNARRLRSSGSIPAVIYREGKPGTNLQIEEKDWRKILSSGQRVVSLKIAGGDRSALIKDVQYDHLGNATLHVDFNELKDGEKVRLAVGIVLKGVPKGASMGGLLNQEMHTIHVECLPNDIPEKIVIDVEALELDQMIHVSDVKLPKGVHATDHANLVVCAVHEPRHEEVAEPVEGAPTEPVVLTAKKDDTAPAAGAAGGAAAGGPPPKKADAKK